MANRSPSQEDLDDPPHERIRKLIVFCGVVAILGAAGWAGWWAFDTFYLSVRIPQQRMLTDRHGVAMLVRIEGRSPELLQVTMLKGGTSRLLAIANLADTDQEAMQRLPVGQTFGFPQPYEMTDASGQTVPARLEGRSVDLLKWTSLKDNAEHWLPLDKLGQEDRNFISGLAPNLMFNYPVKLTLTDETGANVTASVEGRSDVLVQYRTADGETLVPLASLSKETQEQLAIFPTGKVFNYPMDLTLTDQQGRKRQLRLDARAEGAVELTVNGETHLFPIASLSEKDQALMRTMRVSLTLQYPFDMKLADLQKHILEVTLVGRSDNAVQFTRGGDSTTFTYAIAKLDPDTQALVRLFPLTMADTPTAPMAKH